MRKERSSIDNIATRNKIKKSIIKRINDSAQNKNIRKIESNRNKKMNLFLKNDSNSFYKARNKNIELSSQNNNKYHLIQKEKYKNILLGKNSFLSNNNKTRNKNINLHQENKHNFVTRKKTMETYNFKYNFFTNLNHKKKNNKRNRDLMNRSHQSCDEEISRKFYLNGNYRNIYIKCYNKININKPNNYSQISERQYSKYNENTYRISKNSSNNDTNRYIHSYNTGYLTTKEKSNIENTYSNNNYSNFINTSKNNDTPTITNFSYRNNNCLYKKVNLSLISQNQKKYFIESYENNSNNINLQKYNGQQFLSMKRMGFKVYKKHYASKSQENINQNKIKFNHLFNIKDNQLLKKVNCHEYYMKKMKYIKKIQKWWKDMLFHMYIEKKIIYIQKYYRNHLNKKYNKIKLNLDYVYNINKIRLIQKEWKKIFKIKYEKKIENNKDNFLPKTVPFKLDNFNINENNDSNIDIKNQDYNKYNNIYWKKNVSKKKRKLVKNNTVSNFYDMQKNKLTIKNEINFFLISPKQEELSALELQRKINNIKIDSYKEKTNNEHLFSKNISFEIISSNYGNNNSFHLPIKTIMFIEKEYKINKVIINNRRLVQNKNCYITKLIIKKNYVINQLKLIQKFIKIHVKSNKNQFISKPNIHVSYIGKTRKVMNLLDCSSNNKIENFSFKGFIANSNSNKDKTSENDISNSKSEKTNSFYEKDKLKSNNILFSFENSNNKNNNKDSFQTLLLKDKIKNLFNKFVLFKLKLKIKKIVNDMRDIKFIVLFKKYINNKIDNIMINIFKTRILKVKSRLNENIFDEEDIINIINRKKIIKTKSPSNYIITNQKKTNSKISPKEYYINDEEGLSNYILNYFYNKKKFTNINMNLIKERLGKSPLIYRTQSNIQDYINDLHKDILENKICHNCFCKIEENCDIGCSCHKAINVPNIKQKVGISIYRQKINKIIKDNKKNIKIVKNNDENENNNNNFPLFNGLNINNLENGYNEINRINSTINRYDSENMESKSRSNSKD